FHDSGASQFSHRLFKNRYGRAVGKKKNRNRQDAKARGDRLPSDVAPTKSEKDRVCIGGASQPDRFVDRREITSLCFARRQLALGPKGNSRRLGDGSLIENVCEVGPRKFGGITQHQHPPSRKPAFIERLLQPCREDRPQTDQSNKAQYAKSRRRAAGKMASHLQQKKQ